MEVRGELTGAVEQAGHKQLGNGIGHSQKNRSMPRQFPALKHLDHFVARGENAFRIAQEQASGLGKPHPAALAAEEGLAKKVFQIPDLRAQRGCGNLQRQ